MKRVTPNLAQMLGVDLFVETYEHKLANAKQGSTHIAGITQHGRDRFFGGIGTYLELSNFFTLHDNHLGRFPGNFFGCVGLQFLICRNAFFNSQVVGLYKLRGFGAAGSALAVVNPIDGFSFWHNIHL